MEKFFGELIAMRLLLGRVLANQAHASGNAKLFIEDQMEQAKKDLESVNIAAKDKDQEEVIRKMGDRALEDIARRINFPA